MFTRSQRRILQRKKIVMKPIDVHVAWVARRFNLLQRNVLDWQAQDAGAEGRIGLEPLPPGPESSRRIDGIIGGLIGGYGGIIGECGRRRGDRGAPFGCPPQRTAANWFRRGLRNPAGKETRREEDIRLLIALVPRRTQSVWL